MNADENPGKQLARTRLTCMIAAKGRGTDGEELSPKDSQSQGRRWLLLGGPSRPNMRLGASCPDFSHTQGDISDRALRESIDELGLAVVCEALDVCATWDFPAVPRKTEGTHSQNKMRLPVLPAQGCPINISQQAPFEDKCDA